MVQDEGLDPAFRALCLRLPSADDLAQSLKDGGHVPDPDRIHSETRRLAEAVARHLEKPLDQLYQALADGGPFSPDATAAGRRALRLACLSYLNRLDGGARAGKLYAAATNMTDMQGALACLVEAGRGAAELAAFHDRFRANRLVIDKWFTVQVLHAAADQAAATARRLADHPDFDWKNPNRFRALLGGLSANHAGFHHSSGAGYDFYADWLIRLDPVNPQTTARMSTAFETWRRYDEGRQAKARAAMERVLATRGLSRDSGEMIGRLLG
jgi:aminopeptidase N